MKDFKIISKSKQGLERRHPTPDSYGKKPGSNSLISNNLSEIKQSYNDFDFKNLKQIKIRDRPQILGSGSISTIYLSKNIINDNIYAIKQFSKDKFLTNSNIKNSVEREIRVHLKLKHPRIINTYKSHEDKESYYLIMDYAEKGNLSNFLLRNKKGSTEETAFKFFIQILNAIVFLHESGIIHGCITPDNILLDKLNNSLLSDFGNVVENSSPDQKSNTTNFYSAPETVTDSLLNFSSDIWGLGVILYEILFGSLPFKLSDLVNNFNFTLEGKKCSEDLSDLFYKIFIYEPTKRISSKNILRHPWVKRMKETYETIEVDELVEKGKNDIAEIKIKKIEKKSTFEVSKRTERSPIGGRIYRKSDKNSYHTPQNLNPKNNEYLQVDSLFTLEDNNEILNEKENENPIDKGKYKNINPSDLVFINDDSNIFDRVLQKLSGNNDQKGKKSETKEKRSLTKPIIKEASRSNMNLGFVKNKLEPDNNHDFITQNPDFDLIQQLDFNTKQINTISNDFYQINENSGKLNDNLNEIQEEETDKGDNVILTFGKMEHTKREESRNLGDDNKTERITDLRSMNSKINAENKEIKNSLNILDKVQTNRNLIVDKNGKPTLIDKFFNFFKKK